MELEQQQQQQQQQQLLGKNQLKEQELQEELNLKRQREKTRGNHNHLIIPLIEYAALQRWDTLPFLIVYSACVALDIHSRVGGYHDYDDNEYRFYGMIGNVAEIVFPVTLLSHLVLFLATKWSVSVRVFVGYTRCDSACNDGNNTDGNTNDNERRGMIDNPTLWTHCLVVPPSGGSSARNGVTGAASVSTARAEIVPVINDTNDTNDTNGSYNTNDTRKNKKEYVLTITFEEMVFRYCYTRDCEGRYGHRDGMDEHMDAIWGLPSHSQTSLLSSKRQQLFSPTPLVTDRSSNKKNSPSSNHSSPNTSSVLFHRIHFPIDLPLSFYTNIHSNDNSNSSNTSLKQWAGHHTATSLQQTQHIYSNNALRITLPPFQHLLSEQLFAPFFLFQLFCVILWCLDEYWYYAIFTLFTLVLFECTVAFNRLKSLQRLRETLRPPFYLWVYRNHIWNLILTDQLVVGDFVSITSHSHSSNDIKAMRNHHQQSQREHGQHVPADLLLIRGGAVLNEAMLTGESVPQIKESIDIIASASNHSHATHPSLPTLDIDDAHYKRSILFGGTLIVNHTPPQQQQQTQPDSTTKCTIPTAPDKGCIALVLRTGFDTTQGSLLRTMVHSSTKSSQNSNANQGINSIDTFLFILLLLLCAIASSILVLQHGWHDPTRNRFKLLLHVIIIVTSVVPPELPMELSLAVTSSLADLIHRCAVYCTEPFRIPLAGMVTTCCFDKTGTLTSDQMVLTGVRLPTTNNNTNTNTNITIAKHLAVPQTHHYNITDQTDHQSDPNHIPIETLRVMVGCHGLATNSQPKTRDPIIGDPLEKAVLQSCEWSITAPNVVSPPPATTLRSVIIHHRFAFTSKLRRMSVLASDLGSSDLYLLAKGAPETLKQLFRPSSLPQDYDIVSHHHMALGQRVLAMGFRNLTSSSNKSISKSSSSSPSPSSAAAKWKKLGRAALEGDLTFVGFLVLDCPLKPDSARVIRELVQTGHDAVMITGDAVLTAAQVARQVGIVPQHHERPLLQTFELREIHRPTNNGGTSSFSSSSSQDVNANSNSDSKRHPEFEFAFVPVNTPDGKEFQSEKFIAYTPSNLKVIQTMLDKQEIALCVTGDVLNKLVMHTVSKTMMERHIKLSLHTNTNTDAEPHDENEILSDISLIDTKTVLLHPDSQAVLRTLVPMVSVFARHAPRQKEAVIAALNGAGKVTLMIGDGTNDVGALKMAHVGISIVSVPELEAKQREAINGMEKAMQEERREAKKAKKKKKLSSPSDDVEPKKKKSSSSKRIRKRNMEESLRALAESEEELSHVALGDASVASPFTSRTMSIKCTKDVLQRGRCTLVTMLQIYKILGVNCLVNALVLSSLHMAGAKQGDRQLTAVGIVVASLFLFVTKGQPLDKLSPKRPPSSVLCKQALLSIAVQFAIHFICIMTVTVISKHYLDPYDPSLTPDGAFNANILNTSTFLMTVLATINTFVVNYRGRPFMQDLVENKLLVKSLQLCYGILFACALEVFPPLNDLLQLAPLPSGPDSLAHLNFDDLADNERLLLNIIRPLGFKMLLCFLMIIDSVSAYKAEKWIVSFFDI